MRAPWFAVEAHIWSRLNSCYQLVYLPMKGMNRMDGESLVLVYRKHLAISLLLPFGDSSDFGLTLLGKKLHG